MLNHVLVGGGLIEPLAAQSMLDWARIVSPSCGSRRRSSRCCWPARWPRSKCSTSKRRATSAHRAGACCWHRAATGARHAAGRRRSELRDDAVSAVVPLMINRIPTMMTVDVAYRISTHATTRWPMRCAWCRWCSRRSALGLPAPRGQGWAWHEQRRRPGFPVGDQTSCAPPPSACSRS